MGQRVLAVVTVVFLNLVMFAFTGPLVIVSLAASIPLTVALFRL